MAPRLPVPTPQYESVLARTGRAGRDEGPTDDLVHVDAVAPRHHVGHRSDEGVNEQIQRVADAAVKRERTDDEQSNDQPVRSTVSRRHVIRGRAQLVLPSTLGGGAAAIPSHGPDRYRVRLPRDPQKLGCPTSNSWKRAFTTSLLVLLRCTPSRSTRGCAGDSVAPLRPISFGLERSESPRDRLPLSRGLSHATLGVVE